MSSQSGLRTRPLLLLALMSGFWQHAHALSQTYCSSQNTGSDSDAVTNIYQSNGACQQQCVDSYAFAVVQYQQCWCTNYAPADQLDTSDCSQSCPGYPDESCGNEDKGLYGYIKLNISPSGTQGSGSSSQSTSKAASSTVQSTPASSPSSSSAPASSSVQSDNTVYTSVSVTVTVKQSASVVVSYVTASSSDPPTTSSTPSSTSTSSPSSSSPSPTSTSISISLTSTQGAGVTSSPSSSAADSSSLSHTTFVSTRVVTVSGGPVTQTVTSTAVVAPGSEKQTEQKGVSGGTVAGAVIGSIAGVALLLAGAFFLWRRKRSEASDPESPRSGSGSGSSRRTAKRMERNTSVLSRTGLLSSLGNAADGEKSHDDSAAFGVGHKYSNSETTGPSPVSPNGSNRRNSRPMVYDQRLNPAALMENWERNGSRASIGTMQDQRDYSRPLGVTNPDPVGDD